MGTLMTDLEKAEIIRMHKDNMNTVEIGKILNRNQSTVERFLKKNGYAMNYGRKVNKDELNDIKEMYLSGLTSRVIYEKYKHIYKSEEAIQRIIRKMGIARPNGVTNVLNHDYFENIDCERKAYWLGFLTADGCVMDVGHNKKGSKIIQLALQLGDKAILHEFSNDIGTNLQVKEYSYSYKDSAVVIVKSNKMANDLSKYGIVPRKTFEISTIPDIDADLVRHFIRGYFDGDGSAYLTSHKDMNIKSLKTTFCGTRKFLESINQALHDSEVIIEPKPLIDMNKYGSNVFNLRIFNNHELANLYDYMYKDAEIYLDRKKEKFDYHFNIRN